MPEGISVSLNCKFKNSTKSAAFKAHWYFPQEGPFKVVAAFGRESITIFASDKELAVGTYHKGQNTAARYVHQLPTPNSPTQDQLPTSKRRRSMKHGSFDDRH